MQPVRIGVNAAVVLLILLLSVPLQLILSHLVAMSPTTEGRGDITEARSEAMEQLVDTAEAVFDSLHSTITYYSTWNRLKELVLVPYRRTSRTNLKSTVFKSKAGTTTILISSMDETKTKKTSSSDPTKNAGQSETSKTGKTGSSTTSTDQGKQPTLKSQAGSSESETKTEKAENTPKVESTKVTTTTTKTKLPLIIEEVSHAKEVEEYLMNEVYFAQLKTPRNKKPSSVLYSVGQIVQHRTAEYVGVIIGWDKVAMAPDKWIQRYYGNRPGVELTTHYLILVDSKYTASGTPYHYVPQEDIELGPHQQLRCPEVSEFFEGFQNGRHIPKPWLQNRYPLD